jgi:hypothetical protein
MHLNVRSQRGRLAKGGGIAVADVADETGALDALPHVGQACATTTGSLNGAATSEDNPCQA